MTQEDKQLLLKDLSARLPYRVHLRTNSTDDMELLDIIRDTDYEDQFWINGYYDIEDIKPYLRPMSSMTEEEKHELLKFGVVNLDKDNNAIDVCCVGFESHAKVQDYLNSIHFDYRGLIEKGLAIEVTEENNPYKNDI